MKRLLAKLRHESGQAMVVAVFTFALVTTLAVALTDVVTSETQASAQAVTSDGAYQAAEAGLDNYLAKLIDDVQYYSQYVDPAEATRQSGANTPVGVAGACTSSSMPSAVAWTYPATPAWTYPNGRDRWCQLANGFEYDLQITPPSAGQTAIQILSTGRRTGTTSLAAERVIQVLVQPSTISEFFQIVNGNVGFSANTTGKVWSAGSINFSSGTASADLLACSSSGNNAPPMTNGATFYAGSAAVTGQGLSCPPPFSTFLVSISDIKRAAQTNGLYMDDATKSGFKLAFQNNGTIQVQSCPSSQNVEGSTAPTCTTYTPSGCSAGVCNVPSNGAIYVGQDAVVSGSVKGRVTVVSNDNVVVAAPINPVTSGTDVIGLIAENNLIIPKYCCNSGTVFNWDAGVITETGMLQTSVSDASMGTMTFTGSTTNNLGGNMTGFVSPRTYNYDTTMQYLPPPWFPSPGGTPYKIVLFRELPPT